jgi:putative redox protein
MPTASVRWTTGEQFLATTPSGHAVPFDSDRTKNSAPGPMEMLLAALGSCTATDVVSILQKKRQKLESLEVLVSGERAESAPRVWTRIEVVYRLRGELDEKAVKDAIELSQTKYCSVSVMLGKTAKISYRYEIGERDGSSD